MALKNIEMASIHYSTQYLGEKKKDDWGGQIVDEYRATVRGHDFPFFQGIGRRKKLQTWGGGNIFKPMHPKIEDVLHALLADSDALNFSFFDWCACYGYSDDSRKAKRIYEACCETAHALKKIFSSDELASLARQLENY